MLFRKKVVIKTCFMPICTKRRCVTDFDTKLLLISVVLKDATTLCYGRRRKRGGKRNKLYVKGDSGVVLSSYMRTIDLAPIHKQNHVQHRHYNL